MRRAKWLLVTGGGLLVLAIGWAPVVVPALVKFPANIDTTVHYTGTFTTMVDARTMLPLASPRKLPMTVDRHVKVVKSTSSTVTVIEDVTTHVGDQAAQFQHMQYVMDRKTMRFVDSPDTVAFSQSTGIGNPAGTHRVSFPMGTRASGSYPSWTNETGKAVTLTGGSALHLHRDSGIRVIDFRWATEDAVVPAYLNWLQAQGNPTELTPTQTVSILSHNGIDITKAVSDVSGKLTPAESATLQQVLQQPVKLNYRFFSSGAVSIEPRTGAEIYAHADTEGVKVAPDLAGASQLMPLLTKYSGIPSVKAAADGLAKLAARPPQVAAQYRYAQTPVSSAALGRDTRNQLSQLNLVEFRIPWALGLLGAVFVLAGFGLAVLRRVRLVPGDQPVPPLEPGPATATASATAVVPEPAPAPEPAMALPGNSPVLGSSSASRTLT
jgi:hypothetical protein